MFRRLVSCCSIALLCATTGLAGAAEDNDAPRRETDNETGFIGLYDTAPLSTMPREPMWLLNCFGGQRDLSIRPEENVSGVRGDWRGAEGVDWFIRELRLGYSLGARSFFVVRPMGTSGSSHVPASGWLSIPAEKRIALQERVNDLIMDEFQEPIRIYYFIGSYMTDARGLDGYSEKNLPDAFRLGDEGFEAQHATRATLGGLMSAGAAGFGIDASAPLRTRYHYVEFAEQMRRPPFNMHVIGEALPVVPKGRGVARDAMGDFKTDDEALERMAWVGTALYMNYRFHHRIFDPEKTRVFKWYAFREVFEHLSDTEKRQMIQWDFEHGMITICHDKVMFEEALRLYERREQATEANDEKFRYSQAD